MQCTVKRCISVLMAANLGDASSQTEEFRLRRRDAAGRPFQCVSKFGSAGRTRTVRHPSRRLRAIPKNNFLGQIDEGAQARGHVKAP